MSAKEDEFNREKAHRDMEAGLLRVSLSNESFVMRARAIAVLIAASRRTRQVTADDVFIEAERLKLVPKHPNAWGVVFRDKRFRLAGYQHSDRRSRRRGLQRIWELVE